MAETTNYPCPNCGGRMYFDGSIGRLHCEYCDSTFTPAEIEQHYAATQEKADAAAETQSPQPQPTAPRRPASSDPIQAYLQYSKLDDAENLRAYNCSSCGAQLMVDQATAVTSCPYCGSNTVIPGQLSNALKPDFVIPFKKSKEDAVAALAKYYGNKRFLPNTFTSDNHIQEVQGVYVPFWLYTGTTSGEVVFKGTRTMTWEDRDNIHTDTDHYDLYRAGRLVFKRVPVDGSTRMPDAHMDAIEPYDYAELTDFTIASLLGYVTDRYDQTAEDCAPRANKRAEASYVGELQKTCTSFGLVHVKEADVKTTWKNVSYALLPVWMLHTTWNGGDYLFAMNGQTGKLIGDLPIDSGKVAARFFTIFVPLLIVCVLVVTFAFGGYRL